MNSRWRWVAVAAVLVVSAAGGTAYVVSRPAPSHRAAPVERPVGLHQLQRHQSVQFRAQLFQRIECAGRSLVFHPDGKEVGPDATAVVISRQ